MKWTEKKKRYLAIGGGVVVCAALVAAISLQFGKPPVEEDVLPDHSQPVTELIVDPGAASAGNQSEEEQETEKEVVIQPNPDSEESRPVSDPRPAQTDQSEQSIQPEVTKPEIPKEEVLHNPAVRPDGKEMEEPPVPVEHEEVVPPEEPEPVPGEPQAGDTAGGQIYIPGFGWVENHGGGGAGTTADDMYENGNKIGIMD